MNSELSLISADQAEVGEGLPVVELPQQTLDMVRESGAGQSALVRHYFLSQLKTTSSQCQADFPLRT